MWLKLVLLQFTENLQFLADGRLPHVCGIRNETGKFVIACLIYEIKCQPSIEYKCMIFDFKIGGAVTITQIDTSIKCQPSKEYKCMILHLKTGGAVINTHIDTSPPLPRDFLYFFLL